MEGYDYDYKEEVYNIHSHKSRPYYDEDRVVYIISTIIYELISISNILIYILASGGGSLLCKTVFSLLR